MAAIPGARRAAVRTAVSIASIAYVVTLLGGSSQFRGVLTSLFSPRSHPWRFAALVASLVLNNKALPFVWHIRLFFALFFQVYIQSEKLPEGALFKPMVTIGTLTSIPEIDWNMHKSNSTYFADFDVGRSMLLGSLLSTGIRKAQMAEAQGASDDDTTLFKPTKGKPGVAAEAVAAAAETPLQTAPFISESEGEILANEKMEQAVVGRRATSSGQGKRYGFALGGVSCNFKREIKPMQEFEMWTRILCWDEKWVYFIQHLVKPGVVKPDSYLLQPGKVAGQSWLSSLLGRRGPKPRPRSTTVLAELQREEQETWKQAVFATSIAKYVFKRGRRTIPPEQVFRRSDLLPERPEVTLSESTELVEAENDAAAAKSDADDDSPASSAWTWANVERERARGWKLARHFAALEGGMDEFPGSWGMQGPNGQFQVLAEYPDLVL